MLNKKLLDFLFKGFLIQRWNDKLRPIELVEMDKHAHKMMIAWCLGKYEEAEGRQIDWNKIISGGVYELLRRIAISDIQSPVFREIEQNSELKRKLNTWVSQELDHISAGSFLQKELNDYLTDENHNDLESTILSAAHKYATFWEFQIIKNLNVNDFKISAVDTNLSIEMHGYSHLPGINKLLYHDKIKHFVDLFGQMRYQIRWGQLARIPKTSVLGHSIFTAVLSWLLSRRLDFKSQKRLYNNFFGALFHDLPEAVTRDIISPLKMNVPGMSEEIKRIEEKLTREEIFPHVEESWKTELWYFINDEFNSKIKGGILSTTEEICKNYDSDDFDPYDGKIVRASDKLAAFLEAVNSIRFGIRSEELEHAMIKIKKDNIASKFLDVDFKDIYFGYELK